MYRLGLKYFAMLALAGLCGFLKPSPVVASPYQDAPAATSNQSSEKPVAPKPAAKAKSSATTSKKTGTAKTKTATKRRRRPMSPRVRRIRQAFVASTTLRAMAQQLIQDRTPAAYAGVESYARAHSKEDAGALAWLVVGYAHVIDRDFAKAIDPLNRAKPLAGDLGDYVAYYLGTSYLQTGRRAEGLAALANFSCRLPGFAAYS